MTKQKAKQAKVPAWNSSSKKKTPVKKPAKIPTVAATNENQQVLAVKHRPDPLSPFDFSFDEEEERVVVSEETNKKGTTIKRPKNSKPKQSKQQWSIVGEYVTKSGRTVKPVANRGPFAHVQCLTKVFCVKFYV